MTSSETPLPKAPRVEVTAAFLREQDFKRTAYENRRAAWREALEPKPHNPDYVYDTNQVRFFFPPKE